MRATKIAFEKRYPDDSGVESAVMLDGAEIQFERHNHRVAFDIADLEWLRDALRRIASELEHDQLGA